MFTNILQPSHLLIVLIVALLILGPKQLPAAGRALGQGIKEFRGSISGEHPEDEVVTDRLPAKRDDAAGPPGNGPVAAAPGAEPTTVSSLPATADQHD